MERQTAVDWLSSKYEEVDAYYFYRELFPLGILADKGKKIKGKYRGVAVEISGTETNREVKRHALTNGLENLNKILLSDNTIFISPCSYAGNTQQQRYLNSIFSFTFDLDKLISWDSGECGGLSTFFHWVDNLKAFPRPTYVVATDDYNVHLYYFLDKPFVVYPEQLASIREFRKAFITGLWQPEITESYLNPQYETSPNHTFRAVGSITKRGNGRVRAFRTGERVSIDQINAFCPDNCRIAKKHNKYTQEEAKELFPDWYQRVVVEGNHQEHTRKYWYFNRAVYDSFKQRIIDGKNVGIGNANRGSQEGSRFFGLVGLITAGQACNISYEEVEKDCFELVPILDQRTKDSKNHFTLDDAQAALNYWKGDYVKYSRELKEYLTGLELPPQKRNPQPGRPAGRKQTEHLKLARHAEKGYALVGEYEKVGGRPTKTNELERVREYIKQHPQYKVAAMVEELKIPRASIYRYIKELENIEKVRECLELSITSLSEIAARLEVKESKVWRYLREVKNDKNN